MKSAFKTSSKHILWALLTPLLLATGLMGLGALSHCSKTDNQVDPGSGGDACANACTANQVCSKGSCKTTCDSGLTTCGSSCVDTTQDTAHCGACGHVCTANQVCTAGNCTFQIPAAAIQTIAVSQVDRTDDLPGAMSVQNTAQDSQGNVYITGYFQGTLTLGEKSISCQKVSNDVFVAKMGLNGQVIWAKSFKNQVDNISSIGRAIAVDAQGNVYVGGQFMGVVKFDDITLTSTLLNPTPPLYTRNAFLTKLDANGAVLWAFQYGELDTTEAITVDQQGSVIALARKEKATFAIMKYAANTTQNTAAQWTEKWDAVAASFSNTPRLVTDAGGNILMLLNAFQGSISTGASNPNFPKIESAKKRDNFTDSNSLVKLAQDTGAIRWVSSLPFDAQGQMNLFMSQGSLVVMDRFAQDLNFGADSTGNAIKIPAPSDEVNIYWSTWDLTTGNPIAAHALEGSGRKELLGTTVDSQGNVWMMTIFRNQTSYGSTLLKPVRDYNTAVVKLDATGQAVWAERVNDDKSVFYGVPKVVLDAQNSPWLSFNFSQTMSIGGGTKLTLKGNLFDFGFAKLKP